ncbi:MAG: hypothetical protein ACREP3_01790 [Candidatus Binatia bacterium]
MTRVKQFSFVSVLSVLFSYSSPTPAQVTLERVAGEAKLTWETEWRAINEAAKKEGQLTISHTRGPFEQVFAEFSKRHPGIKVVSISGRGGDLISRIMAERRAEKYVTDLYLGSSGTPMDVLHPAQVLEPVPAFMILPEVKDQSNWFRKQHHYADPEARYIFVFEGVVRSDIGVQGAGRRVHDRR